MARTEIRICDTCCRPWEHWITAGRRPTTCPACKKEKDRARNAAWRVKNNDYSKRRRETHPEETKKVVERYKARTDEKLHADLQRLRPDGLKRCRSGHWLSIEQFPRNTRQADGLHPFCRTCKTARTRLLRRALPRWEERDTWNCVYTGLPFDDVEHIIPRAASDTVPGLNLDDPGNLAPASWEANRGPGGKFDRPVLNYVEDLHGPGVIEWLMAGGVEWRELVPV